MLKTYLEVMEWCSDIARELGDPAAATGNLFARFKPEIDRETEENRGLVAARWNGSAIELALMPNQWMPIEVDPDGMQIDPIAGGLHKFGITKIADGLWTLEPSLNFPRTIHVFVTFYDVPTPAPWESLIVTLGGGKLIV